MNPYLITELVAAHRADLERHAACCTPVAEHRRNLRAAARERRAGRRLIPGRQPVCCA
ncbi:MAG TPA: hypothetical protein VG325_18150 [Solirubrobacteraceae bacterium]|jgi:hypothetical protein|nr:hypothetical protein [Solirubrobacteraceae bacterium]